MMYQRCNSGTILLLASVFIFNNKNFKMLVFHYESKLQLWHNTPFLAREFIFDNTNLKMFQWQHWKSSKYRVIKPLNIYKVPLVCKFQRLN